MPPRKTSEAIARPAAKNAGKRPAAAAPATGGRPDSAAKTVRQPEKFDELVHGKPLMGTAAIEAIRRGYPAAIMKSASAFLGVSEARIQRVMHVSPSTASRLIKQKEAVDAAATERVLRISDVTRFAIEVFEDESAAKDWLRMPNESLGQNAPLDLLDTEPGAVTVRQVLNAIATGAPL
ncbi:type II RES/Xre toxin-antitoxin system antitoxin [Noviherbaspirillum aridicola]|uniref:Toxin-antitoxin system antitoxin component (TIGR02293 family) n=1 Tax=Noviherbaspirillum aridicola TaxID=2849687 RepID=A0ABQ4Q9A8_9BURK|nr:antitoxin Xre/MbcA/ParS toxin-binding domain-containing protein [Noviherbaspirillum aridicola]GIZ53657.1 hypothetical protein NCCP691_36710 [Noviherbaspirillum aridicola]